MRPVNRIVLCLVVLALSGTSVSQAATTAEPATRLYVGQTARLSAWIPSDWTAEVSSQYDYRDGSGFVVSYPIAGQALDLTCAIVAALVPFSESETSVITTAWSGQPACRIDGNTADGPTSALVVPHPFPFALYDERMTYAVLITDSDSFQAISTTLSFSPDRVSPESYVASVLDLVEARAYFSGGIDWDLARHLARVRSNGINDLSLAKGIISDLIASLRAVGDTHSYVLWPEQVSDRGETAGAGFLVAGRRVVLVYPDSPADLAGVRAGDVLEAVDDQPFLPTLNPVDAGALIEFRAKLTLRRPGVATLLTVGIQQGPYSQYAPPTGHRLIGDLGYVEFDQFSVPGRESDYVIAARSAIQAVNQSPTCGWVVDLRLNMGGSYSPMVAGVGPILGDGTFVGWQRRDGNQTWVTYDDGRITDDGQPVADYSDLSGTEPLLPAPPVAVLTSPVTGSSGEVATLAFVGRPDTRSFGEATGSYATAIRGFSLFDGSVIGLATAAMTDRLGTTYLAGIEPDEHVTIDWETFGTDEDPVVQAAMTWLNQKSGCSDATPVP